MLSLVGIWKRCNFNHQVHCCMPVTWSTLPLSQFFWASNSPSLCISTAEQVIHTPFYINCLFLFKNNIPYYTNTERGEGTISYTISIIIIISHRAHTHNMCPRLLSSSIFRQSLWSFKVNNYDKPQENSKSIIDTNKLRNWFWRWLLLKFVETSVTNNSSFQNYPHMEIHTIRTIHWMMGKLRPINRSHKSTSSVAYGLFFDKQLINIDCYWLSLAVLPIIGFSIIDTLEKFCEISSETMLKPLGFDWSCVHQTQILFFSLS